MDEVKVGTTERPLRAVVIGSGPSGFYAAEALLKEQDLEVHVDLIDRLPTPFGLVRGGVAPDHQKIKGVTKVFDRVAHMPNFRFWGNVKLGHDVLVDDLHQHYDVIIYAVGNESDHAMGIPGEDLGGSHAATEFVGWYNGHPDHREHAFDLSCERVAVVGIGNVAMDVTRILAEDVDVLAKTDIAEHAVTALRKSKVKEVILLGRRGPLQAAFSPAEIKEIADLSCSDLVVTPEDAQLDAASQGTLEAADKAKQKNVAFLAEQAQKGEGQEARKVRLRLCVSPVELLGEGGKVTQVKIEKNALHLEEKTGRIRPKGTGEFETIDVGMVLRSVGYFGVKIPGVSFDEKKGRIPNLEGRVTMADWQTPIAGEYVVGWAKRGPSGLIGTNRADSVETVKRILDDWRGKEVPYDSDKTAPAAQNMLLKKQPNHIHFEDWEYLDQLEQELGKKQGKVRAKFTDVQAMLDALKAAKRADPC
jgi:ferredoxin--NADP+ reductase